MITKQSIRLCICQCRQLSLSALVQVQRKPLNPPPPRYYKPVTSRELLNFDYFDNLAASVDFGPEYLDRMTKIWKDRECAKEDLAKYREDKLVEHVNFNLPPVDPDDLVPDFKDAEALKNAPESVRKIFSIGLATEEQLKQYWYEQYVDKLRTHSLDTDSLPLKVLRATVEIRATFKSLHELVDGQWNDRIIKARMKHIDICRVNRQQCLDELVLKNKAQFDKVVEILDLIYVRPVEPEDAVPEDRIGWCKLKAESIKLKKLTDYRNELAAAADKELTEIQSKLQEIGEQKSKLLEDIENYEKSNRVDPTAVVGLYEKSTIDSVSENNIMRHYYMPRPKSVR